VHTTAKEIDMFRRTMTAFREMPGEYMNLLHATRQSTNEVGDYFEITDEPVAHHWAQTMGERSLRAKMFIVDLYNVPDSHGYDPQKNLPLQRLPFPDCVFFYDIDISDGDTVHAQVATCALHCIEDEDNEYTMMIPYLRWNDQPLFVPFMTAGILKWGIDTIVDDSGLEERRLISFAGGFDIKPDFKDEALNMCDSGATILMDILTLINAINVDIELVTPSRLKQMRAKKKGIALEQYHTIKLPQHNDKRYIEHIGTHASPAMHVRRGHYRRLHRGTDKQRDVYVHPCIVGARENGIIKSDYKVDE